MSTASARRGGSAAKQSGKEFEAMLDEQHRFYLQAGLAYAIKTTQPIRMLSGMDDRGSFRACYAGEGPPDYIVVSDGRTFVLEAKRTADTRWPFAKLKRHQAVHLDAIEAQGVRTAVILRFGVEKRTVLILWPALRERWWVWANLPDGTRAKNASLNLAEAMAIGIWSDARVGYLRALLDVPGDYLDELLRETR